MVLWSCVPWERKKEGEGKKLTGEPTYAYGCSTQLYFEQFKLVGFENDVKIAFVIMAFWKQKQYIWVYITLMNCIQTPPVQLAQWSNSCIVWYTDCSKHVLSLWTQARGWGGIVHCLTEFWWQILSNGWQTHRMSQCIEREKMVIWWSKLNDGLVPSSCWLLTFLH